MSPYSNGTRNPGLQTKSYQQPPNCSVQNVALIQLQYKFKDDHMILNIFSLVPMDLSQFKTTHLATLAGNVCPRVIKTKILETSKILRQTNLW